MSQVKNQRRVNDKEALAICHSIRTSPRKLNLVAQTIRGMSASKAVAELSFSKRRIAKGSGVDINEVNRLVKQFEQTRKMMKQMPGMMGGGKPGRMGGLFGKRGGFRMPF